MANTARKIKPDKNHHEKDVPLKGTLASVMLLGLFIVLTWVSVYFLFLNRL